MADERNQLAAKVVAAFRDSLSEQARRSISDAEFEQLSVMISEALATEKHATAELIEDMARKLKADAAPPDISL